jgi:hypothetical protein
MLQRRLNGQSRPSFLCPGAQLPLELPCLHLKVCENDAQETRAKVVSLTGEDFGKPVFCGPDWAVLVVADALKREGINAHVTGSTTAIEDDEPASICLCYIKKCCQSEAQLRGPKAFE